MKVTTHTNADIPNKNVVINSIYSSSTEPDVLLAFQISYLEVNKMHVVQMMRYNSTTQRAITHIYSKTLAVII